MRVLKFVVAAFIIATLFVAAVWATNSRNNEQPDQNTNVTETDEMPESKKEVIAFDAEKVAAVLENWASRQNGTYGVTIMDEAGGVLAEVNGNKEFFAASLYKLYVAYAGYQKLDDGTFNPDEPYIADKNIDECLLEMIRSSDSPCAEKMWVELGRENITRQLQTYGLLNTSMSNITTSSHDAAIILTRLHNVEDLSAVARRRMLNSMETQIYRDALPKGFLDATVRNKVGFREKDEYHDVALIELADGRTLIVSVLTSNVGTANIVDLARRLSQAL
jgi:beta-lactamase class A